MSDTHGVTVARSNNAAASSAKNNANVDDDINALECARKLVDAAKARKERAIQDVYRYEKELERVKKEENNASIDLQNAQEFLQKIERSKEVIDVDNNSNNTSSDSSSTNNNNNVVVIDDVDSSRSNSNNDADKDRNRPNQPIKLRTRRLSAHSKHVFDNIVWPKLQLLGWKVEFTNQPIDRYYISPNDLIFNGIRFHGRLEVLHHLEKISNENDDAAYIVKLYEDSINAESNFSNGNDDETSNPTRKKRKPNTNGRPNRPKLRKANVHVFDNIVWPKLQLLGWKVEFGNDPINRYYICPYGFNGNGFHGRLEVLNHLEKISNENDDAAYIVKMYEDSINAESNFSNGNDDETSSPTRKKRKPIKNGAAWTDEENLRMYKAMQEKDHNWRSVAEAVGNRSQTSVEQHVRSTNYKNFVQNTIRMLKQTKTSGKKIAKKFVGSHVQMEESTFNESSRIMKEWSISDDKNEPRAMKSMSLSSVDKSQDDSLSEFDTDESLGRNYNECLPEGNGQNSPSNSETKYRELKTVKTEPANSDDGKTNDTDEEDRESGFSETGQSKIIEKNLDREGKHYHLCSSQSVIEASIKVENEAVSDRLQDIEQAVNSKAYI